MIRRVYVAWCLPADGGGVADLRMPFFFFFFFTELPPPPSEEKGGKEDDAVPSGSGTKSAAPFILGESLPPSEVGSEDAEGRIRRHGRTSERQHRSRPKAHKRRWWTRNSSQSEEPPQTSKLPKPVHPIHHQIVNRGQDPVPRGTSEKRRQQLNTSV